MIVCLLTKLSFDIRFRMMDGKSELVILMPSTVSSYNFLWFSLFGSYVWVEEKNVY